jgi:hypothetical protein
MSYIPRPDAEFALWFDNFVRQVGLHTSGSPPDWPHIPAEAKEGLMEAHGRWQMAYQEANDDPTPAKKSEKTRVRKKEEKDAIRPFVNQYMHFAPVTDEQRHDAGVTNYDPTNTPAPIPPKGPGSRTVTSSAAPGSTEIWYLGAKPYGVSRIEIAYVVAAGPVTDFALLTERDTFSHNPWEKTFMELRGKVISYCLRYLLAGGESKWSEIKSVVIP